MIKAKLSPAFPQLPTGDVEKTAEFFVNKLGFEIMAKYVDQKFLIVRRGPAEIHFWQAADEAEAKKLGSDSSCYIRVENIDPLVTEFNQPPHYCYRIMTKRF